MSQDRLKRIEADLQRAPTVIYLEGKTDEPLLFALAGISRPSSGIYKGVKDVYVVGLATGASGGKEVRALVETAVTEGYAGRLGAGGVFGIIDGDGEDLAILNTRFLAPHAGPLFSWPAYCIENLLTTAWPSAWGNTPIWSNELPKYVPYAALNRVHVQLQSALNTLGVGRFNRPSIASPLKTVSDIKAALANDKDLLLGCDVEQMFDEEVNRMNAAIARSLDEGHAHINGKWFLQHCVPTIHPGVSEDKLRKDWAEAVRQAGGHPAVRGLWTRIVGSAP